MEANKSYAEKNTKEEMQGVDKRALRYSKKALKRARKIAKRKEKKVYKLEKIQNFVRLVEGQSAKLNNKIEQDKADKIVVSNENYNELEEMDKEFASLNTGNKGNEQTNIKLNNKEKALLNKIKEVCTYVQNIKKVSPKFNFSDSIFFDKLMNEIMILGTTKSEIMDAVELLKTELGSDNQTEDLVNTPSKTKRKK